MLLLVVPIVLHQFPQSFEKFFPHFDCSFCCTHTHTITHPPLALPSPPSIILGGENGPPLSPTFLTELRNLYYFITEKLISYMSRIHNSKREMGELLIDVLCYISAIDYDNMATFPEVFASCLLYFLPSSDWERAADEVLNRLCRYVLPKCLGTCTCICILIIIMTAFIMLYH